MKSKQTDTGNENRLSMRFNTVLPVVIGSELFGDCDAVARNISAGGAFLEMSDPMPIGEFVTVHFQMPDSHGELSVTAEVKHHYCFNFTIDDEPASTRGVGVKFIEFLPDSERDLSLRHRTLH